MLVLDSSAKITVRGTLNLAWLALAKTRMSVCVTLRMEFSAARTRNENGGSC